MAEIQTATTLKLVKASKKDAKLRLCLTGLPGHGKTYSALSIATNLLKAEGKPNGNILVLDSEHGSAEKYADKFDFFHWDVVDHDPRNYISLLYEAALLDVDAVILDSLSHAWWALLEIVEQAGTNQWGKVNTFGGWKEGTPIQRQFIEAILSVPMHVIATARCKSVYDVSKDEKGHTKIMKLGTKPEQRENLEYEFDIAGEMVDSNLRITKTRCEDLPLHKAFFKPGGEFANICLKWLKAPSISEKQILQAEKQTPATPQPAANDPAPPQAVPPVESAPGKSTAAESKNPPVNTTESTRVATSEEQENASPAASSGDSTAGENGSVRTTTDPKPENQSSTNATVGGAIQTTGSGEGTPVDVAGETIWNHILGLASQLKNRWSSMDVYIWCEASFGIPKEEVKAKLTTNQARLVYKHLQDVQKGEAA